MMVKAAEIMSLLNSAMDVITNGSDSNSGIRSRPAPHLNAKK